MDGPENRTLLNTEGVEGKQVSVEFLDLNYW